MLVTSLAHAKRVLANFEPSFKKFPLKRKYLVVDTEGQPRPGFSSDDTLVYERAACRVFSIAFCGQHYSFATSLVDSKFPTALQYGKLFEALFQDSSVTIVCHNWIYDSWVFSTEFRLRLPPSIWCTLVSSWMGAEYLPKGLKERALRYGRILRETSNVNFASLDELSDYAEEDVIQAEEMYWYQRYGKLFRSRFVKLIGPKGVTTKRNILPLYPALPKNEILDTFRKNWLYLQEFPVIRSNVRAQALGFPFDFQGHLKTQKLVLKAQADALKTIYGLAGRVFNTDSTKDLAQVCTELGINNPHKTKTGASAFNAKSRSKLEATTGHPFFSSLRTAKEVAKLIAVYIGERPLNSGLPHNHKDNQNTGLAYYINPRTGSIHATVNTVGAITGRSSSSNPNLQQVPSRKDTFGIKNLFIANRSKADDYVLIVLDHSQLEIRVMGLLSKDPEITRILSDPAGDIHQNTADKFSVQRDPYAKNLNFLLLYGGEEYMLSEALTFVGAPTTVQQAGAYRAMYNQVHYRVPEYRQELLQFHQEHDYIELWCHRQRHLPGVDWTSKYDVHKAETTLSNNVVQGSGQDFLKAAIVRLDTSNFNPDKAALQVMSGSQQWRAYTSDTARRLEKYRETLKLAQCRYLLQIHDELVFRVRKEAASECLRICATVMSWRHYLPTRNKYTIPLVAEGGTGLTWKQAKSKDKALEHFKFGEYDKLEN